MTLSFRTRTVIVILATSSAAAIVACLSFLWYDQVTYEKTVLMHLRAQAGATGSNCVAALQFHDAEAAREILNELEHESSILSATILDENGRFFASYPSRVNSEGAAPARTDGPFNDRDSFGFQSPIILNKKRIGTILLRSSLEPLQERHRSYLLTTIVALIASLTVAFGVAMRLLKTVVAPVLSLAEAARWVTLQRDYSVRAKKVSSDEVGTLTVAFNDMLAEIQRQQQDLEEARQELEARVVLRTRELELAMEASRSVSLSLEESEKRFRALSDNAPIGIVQIDSSNRIEYINDYLLHFLNLRREDLDESPLAQVVHDDDIANIRSLWQRALDSRSAMSCEFRVKSGDEIRWAEMRSIAITFGTEYAGRLGTIADITSRKQSESEREMLNRERIRLSREAGMAEVATGVLHNVGNVLNSVNVSVMLIADLLRKASARDLERIVQLIEENSSRLADFLTNDKRGKVLPYYLKVLARTMEQERVVVQNEVDSLLPHVEHIKKTVKMQQSYARSCGVTEPVMVSQVIDEALVLTQGSLNRHKIQIVHHVEDIPQFTVDKHKIVQILVNLINNAKQALVDIGQEVRRIEVTATLEASNTICIEVKDNGIGISAETLKRLFTFGFTTKADGHGFGLHGSALAAQQLGGSLEVESEGLGYGAQFVLKFPVQFQGQSAASDLRAVG